MLLTLVGPCIIIYFYSKTNQMHGISNLFYFGTTLYVFRMVSPSIIRSLRLYIQHQVRTFLDSEDGRRDRPKLVECCSKIK